MAKMTRALFEELSLASDTPLPIAIEDGRMGMCNHWDDDFVLVDAYRGNDGALLKIPYSNIIHLGGGALVAGLKGVSE